jgi:hypothetical protein
MLRLLLGVEVVEVAEELVEAVHGRQELVAVAQVVLAELAGGVASGLSASAMVMSSARRPRLAPAADLGEPGAQGRLAGDEGRRGRPCSSARRSSR